MTEKEMSDTCPMQKSEMQLENMHSNCSNENPSDDNVCMEMQSCCKTETIIAGVKDSFISDKTELQKNLVPGLNPVSQFANIIIPQTISVYSFINTSSPLLSDNHLYNLTTVLLI
jgi:hypothetical protein